MPTHAATAAPAAPAARRHHDDTPPAWAQGLLQSTAALGDRLARLERQTALPQAQPAQPQAQAAAPGATELPPPAHSPLGVSRVYDPAPKRLLLWQEMAMPGVPLAPGIMDMPWLPPYLPHPVLRQLGGEGVPSQPLHFLPTQPSDPTSAWILCLASPDARLDWLTSGQGARWLFGGAHHEPAHPSRAPPHSKEVAYAWDMFKDMLLGHGTSSWLPPGTEPQDNYAFIPPPMLQKVLDRLVQLSKAPHLRQLPEALGLPPGDLDLALRIQEVNKALGKIGASPAQPQFNPRGWGGGRGGRAGRGARGGRWRPSSASPPSESSLPPLVRDNDEQFQTADTVQVVQLCSSLSGLKRVYPFVPVLCSNVHMSSQQHLSWQLHGQGLQPVGFTGGHSHSGKVQGPNGVSAVPSIVQGDRCGSRSQPPIPVCSQHPLPSTIGVQQTVQSMCQSQQHPAVVGQTPRSSMVSVVSSSPLWVSRFPGPVMHPPSP